MSNGSRSGGRSIYRLQYYSFVFMLYVFLGLQVGCALLKSGSPEHKEECIITPKPVTWMHWQECIDTCKGRTPQSILKELDTPYIVCECRDGKRYRMTKMIKKGNGELTSVIHRDN